MYNGPKIPQTNNLFGMLKSTSLFVTYHLQPSACIVQYMSTDCVMMKIRKKKNPKNEIQ